MLFLRSDPHIPPCMLAVLALRKSKKSPPPKSSHPSLELVGRGQCGALFGLDARIALMIFGILALVTGYVAFGRIEIARQAALVGELQAFDMAFLQYQKDMGTFYMFTLDKAADDNDSSEDLTALWDKTKVKSGFQARWNGPYLSRETRKSKEYGLFSLFYAQADRLNYCAVESECAIWLSLANVPAKRWEEVNRIIDEGGGKYPEGEAGDEITKGRVQADGASDPRMLFFRIDGRAKP